ncbi:hypothetical protein CSC94_08915 [Zhengella mangrovi]|uniref:Uncharacterized protein n=1 Tax=Zhengella mangrovi TaxID=1982044 RepID=A0A2G1QRF6_9HYPH|nr:hypothetical protein [Zhengella mangrovi]PHP67788.1 hypothetical protein CSC94_08915 [Zhengella mangrovi]
MLKFVNVVVGSVGILMVSLPDSSAATYRDITLGGVNLTAWCQKQFGKEFKAKLIEKNAGGWTCEQSAGNRRPISVKNACKMQYGKRAYKAKAIRWSDPYSWRCFARERVPTMKGVDLTPWCKKTYGEEFKAKLIGKTAGDWTCEQSAGNRRPILVKSACRLQYGKKVYDAKALNWNDPYSWKCMMP